MQNYFKNIRYDRMDLGPLGLDPVIAHVCLCLPPDWKQFLTGTFVIAEPGPFGALEVSEV